MRGVWDHYFALQGDLAGERSAAQENDALKLAISQLQSKAAEADRLAGLLNFKQIHEKVPMVRRAGDWRERGNGEPHGGNRPRRARRDTAQSWR